MKIWYSNLSEQYRNLIDSKSELLWNDNPSEKEFEKAIWRYFKDIRNSDEVLYLQLMGMVIADDYKMLYKELVESFLTSEQMEQLDFYRNADSMEIIDYYESEPDLLPMAIGSLSDFNCYDFFDKRRILKLCNGERDKLHELSPYCALDYLYYCKPYDIEEYKNMFLDLRQDGYSQKKSIDTLTDTTQQLLMCDTENYVELVSDMLYKFYLLRKNNYFKKDKYNLIPYLEQEEERDILNYIKDSKIIEDVIRKSICYDVNSDKLKINKCDEKAIQKIKSIKEIYK